MPRSKVSQKAHRHFEAAKPIKRYHESLDFINIPFTDLYNLRYGQLQELMKSIKAITKLVSNKVEPSDDNTHADNQIVLNLLQNLVEEPEVVPVEPEVAEPEVKEPEVVEPEVVEPEPVPVPVTVPVKRVVRRGAKYLARKKAEELRLASRTPEEIEADEATRRANQKRIKKEQKELADERTRRERYPELYDDCRATRGHISSYHNPS